MYSENFMVGVHKVICTACSWKFDSYEHLYLVITHFVLQWQANLSKKEKTKNYHKIISEGSHCIGQTVV